MKVTDKVLKPDMFIKVLKGIEVMSDGFHEDLSILLLGHWWEKWNKHPKVLLHVDNTRLLLKEYNLHHSFKFFYGLFVIID